jgi:DNA-binding phage protein
MKHDTDPAHLIKALDTVSDAPGMAKIAKAAGARPGFTTINREKRLAHHTRAA